MLRVHLADIAPSGIHATRKAIDAEAVSLLWTPRDWKQRRRGVWSTSLETERGKKERVYRVRTTTGYPARRAFHLLTSHRGYEILDPYASEFDCVQRLGPPFGNLMHSADELMGVKRDFYTLDRKDHERMMFTSKSVEDAGSLVSLSGPTAHLSFALCCETSQLDDGTFDPKKSDVTAVMQFDYGVEEAPSWFIDAIAVMYSVQLRNRLEAIG